MAALYGLASRKAALSFSSIYGYPPSRWVHSHVVGAAPSLACSQTGRKYTISSLRDNYNTGAWKRATKKPPALPEISSFRGLWAYEFLWIANERRFAGFYYSRWQILRYSALSLPDSSWIRKGFSTIIPGCPSFLPSTRTKEAPLSASW